MVIRIRRGKRRRRDRKENEEGVYRTEKDRLQYLLTLVLTLAALIAIVCYSSGSFYLIAKEDAVTIGERTVSEEAEKLNNFLLRGLDVLQVTGLTIDYLLQKGSNFQNIKRRGGISV